MWVCVNEETFIVHGQLVLNDSSKQVHPLEAEQVGLMLHALT